MSTPQEQLREFGLTTWSINNRTTVFVITAIVALSGVYSYISVPKESFPEIVVPEVFIGTAYPGNSPTNIEKLITQPLEKELNTVSGVDEIISTSVQGFSSIDVKFTFDVSPDEALRKVKDAVDKVKADPDFPKDLPAEPNVFELNFSELLPAMNVNLSGNYSADELKGYAELLEERIEALPEISKVDIRGAMDKELEVEVDYLRAEAMQVSFNDIAFALASENLTVSGGDLLTDRFRRTVQVVGDFETPDDLLNVVVKAEGGRPVYLRDVATVAFKEKEKTSYAREFRQPVISLDIVKRAGENIIVASEGIQTILAEARAKELPSDLTVTITNDQSYQTRSQVDELQNSIIFGILLVVGVLMFFLGLRNALFVGVAIPMSMFLSFIVLAALGITFNTMVLFSLVLALGMLVDNGIVVVENVYRYMDEGKSPYDAAKYGVGEIAWPIISSTATTVAAFIPLALWPGLIGQFMQYLPITLMVVLSASLFVALVINPVLAVLYMRAGVETLRVRQNLIAAAVLVGIGAVLLALGATVVGNLFVLTGLFLVFNVYLLTPAATRFQERFLPRLENGYEALIRTALRGRNPWAFFYGTIALMVVGFVLLGLVPPRVEFFPSNEPQYVNIFISKPIGTDIEETNRVTKEVEALVDEVLHSDAFKRPNPKTGELESFISNSVIALVGNGTSDPSEGPSFGDTPHKARIAVNFVQFPERRGLSTKEVLNALRDRLNAYPDAEIVVAKNSNGPPQAPPINIELRGENYEEVLTTANGMRQFLRDRNFAGVEELKIDVNKQKPEITVEVDREKARQFGLSTQDVGFAIRSALYGREVSTFKDGEDDYPINLRFAASDRHDIDALMNQKVIFRSQSDGQIKEVPISAVASIRRGTTFSAVKRKDLDRVVTLSSNVLEGANANLIVADMQEQLKAFATPEGVEWEFTGQQEEQAKEMAFLSKALLAALFLIFFIIVAQFNSVSRPFIIGFSVLFSLIGVILGLVIFRMDFVIIMTMIGIISLAGVVVNNAIVLIDYTDLVTSRSAAARGLERLPFSEVTRAIIEGGKTRLRPVLLTAITTVLGLYPLAVGFNIDFFSFLRSYDANIYMGGDNNMFWKPMSWAIIYGLTFATFLTLVIVPVMYWWMLRMKYKYLWKEAV